MKWKIQQCQQSHGAKAAYYRDNDPGNPLSLGLFRSLFHIRHVQSAVGSRIPIIYGNKKAENPINRNPLAESPKMVRFGYWGYWTISGVIFFLFQSPHRLPGAVVRRRRYMRSAWLLIYSICDKSRSLSSKGFGFFVPRRMTASFPAIEEKWRFLFVGRLRIIARFIIGVAAVVIGVIGIGLSGFFFGLFIGPVLADSTACRCSNDTMIACGMSGYSADRSAF